MEFLVKFKTKFENVLLLHADSGGKKIAIASDRPDQVVLWDHTKDESIHINTRWELVAPWTYVRMHSQ